MEINKLTGLHFNNSFFEAAKTYLEKSAPNYCYCMMAVDIEHFRLLNKLHGREEGDVVLANIGATLRDYCEFYGGVAGYLGGDNFGIVCVDNMAHLDVLRHKIREVIQKWNNTMGYLPAFGIYPISDKSVDIATMYDRATIALASVIGNYTARVAVYHQNMENEIEEELRLLAEIQFGMEMKEFTFYIQPQCDITKGKIVGGEVLVRWNNRDRGLVSPGAFIPILEKNGFIADLDRYIWEEVCKWLHDSISNGTNPLPLSVNVSRIDIYTMDVCECLIGLVEKYDIPVDLLQIEITESAYTDTKGKIIDTVKRLRKFGFTVLMDDFGSGYSSLNMLKSVPVDVLKIDMRFLDINEQDAERGVGILESVVNMARQMQVPIIVEGVETRAQEELLKTMGCRYTQGYLYYRPMPNEEFRDILTDEEKLDYSGFWCKQTEPLKIKELFDGNLFNNATINNILGPVAFYDVYDNQINVVRVNDQYVQLAGHKEEDENIEVRFWNHVRDDDRQLLFSIFQKATENRVDGAEGRIHFVREDGKDIWVHMKVFFLREKDGHKYYYASLADVSQYEIRRNLKSEIEPDVIPELTKEQYESLELNYRYFPYGYTLGKVELDEQGKPMDYKILFANEKMAKMCDGDMAVLHQQLDSAFSSKKPEIFRMAYEAAYKGNTGRCDVYSDISSRYIQFVVFPYAYGYASLMIRDATHAHLFENTMNHVMYDYREVYYLNLEDNYCRMMHPDKENLQERGNYEEMINRHFRTGKIVPENEEQVRGYLSLRNLRKALRTKDSVQFTYRRMVDDVTAEWCQTTFTVSERCGQVPRTAIVMIRSIESLVREREEYRRKHIGEILGNMSEGFFIYQADAAENLLYINQPALEIFGCDTVEEFREYTGGSFHGMLHPEDVNRIEFEINEQIRFSEKKMDYISYRIIRKDGSIRWIEDYGHLEYVGNGEKNVFYVFIMDVTDSISEQKKQKLLRLSEKYNQKSVM